MKCLVLGGGGFIGSFIVDRLLIEGNFVRVFERPRVVPYRPFKPYEKVEWLQGDFISRTDVMAAVQGCEMIFHLISTTLPKNSNDNPVYDVESNLVPTIQLLESAVHYGVRKVIFISSGGTIYGIPRQLPIPETHPTEPLVSYGVVKLTIEKYLQLYYSLYGLDYSILRVANPFGERQRVNTAQGAVSVFLSKAVGKDMIDVWGDGSVKRDFIYILDVVDAFIKLMDHFGEPRIFNIGSGYGRSVNDLLSEIEGLIGHPVMRRYLPDRKFDVPVSILDISRANEILGWQPRFSFRDGLQRTLDSIRNSHTRSS
jgi:UDP-glucose 4-epimerase